MEVGQINRELKSSIVGKYGSQREFSQVSRVPEYLVSQVVRGRYNLTRMEQAAWAKMLDGQPDQLFDNAD